MATPQPRREIVARPPEGECAPAAVFDPPEGGTPAMDDRPPGLKLADVVRVATGKGVRVLIVGTGVDAGHPGLVGRVKDGRSFVGPGTPTSDAIGHGTFLAGVIANGDTRYGPEGIAPDVELYSARVVGANGYGNAPQVAAALHWGKSLKPDICLFGVTMPFGDNDVLDGLSRLYHGGTLLVAPAGNVYMQRTGQTWPSKSGIVLAVANCSACGWPDVESATGPDIDCATWGGPRVGLWHRRRSAMLGGTGPAAALVAGFAAVLVERQRALGRATDPGTLAKLILDCCPDDLPDDQGDSLGNGPVCYAKWLALNPPYRVFREGETNVVERLVSPGQPVTARMIYEAASHLPKPTDPPPK